MESKNFSNEIKDHREAIDEVSRQLHSILADTAGGSDTDLRSYIRAPIV